MAIDKKSNSGKKENLDVFSYDSNIVTKPVEQIIHESMLPYSEYVIMDRALPRVEDGLKPVQLLATLCLRQRVLCKESWSHEKPLQDFFELFLNYHFHPLIFCRQFA